MFMLFLPYGMARALTIHPTPPQTKAAGISFRRPYYENCVTSLFLNLERRTAVLADVDARRL
jgi:hypothetical protein